MQRQLSSKQALFHGPGRRRHAVRRQGGGCASSVSREKAVTMTTIGSRTPALAWRMARATASPALAAPCTTSADGAASRCSRTVTRTRCH